MKKESFRFVDYAWDEAVAARLDPVAKLVYRSNLLGSDQRITNSGGGNTSSKIIEFDPLTKQPVEVLWVKGSGGDLRTAKKDNFSSLYQNKLHSLQAKYLVSKLRGPKTETEDSMVGLYDHCSFNLNLRAPSIDTPLHSFVPYKHVDHMHPNAVIAVAASKHAREITKKIYGDDVRWIPWQRPGFDLGLTLQELCRKYPRMKGVVLGQHGLINWADDDKECYDCTLTLIERAAEYIMEHDKGVKTFGGQRYRSPKPAERRAILVRILPWIRGQVSQKRRSIGTVQHDDTILRFVNSSNAKSLAALGTSCPDHFLRTKIQPLFVDWDAQRDSLHDLKKKLSTGLTKYRSDYTAYYNRRKRRNSPAMRDANPTVILIPGLGMVAWGKDKSESRVTAEFYNCAVEVMRGAEAIDKYVALPQQEAFDIEYWLLEEAKLRRMPAEKELARRIFCVIGAGSGIGKQVVQRLSEEGAHLVCVDINEVGALAAAKAVTVKRGKGVGVAGSGVSNCGPALGLTADIANRESIREMLANTILAYGGLDGIAVTAGIFVSPDTAGNIPDAKWALTYAINVTGSYLVADEARSVWREQGLPADLVLTTSANAVVPKKGSLAYDTSKAAANHLVRELAIDLAPLVRVNGVAPATVIEGSSMFPRDRVIASLAKYKIPYANADSDDTLRNKLAQFYAQRTLTGKPVTTGDQAEAIYLFLSNRLEKTTGQILSVDGGLQEAFLR